MRQYVGLGHRTLAALAMVGAVVACGGGGGGGSTGQAPAPQITSPSPGATFRAGDTVAFSGTATDPEEGVLPPASLTWWAELHHDTHTHPFVPQTAGGSGTATISARGETSDNIFYRFHLRATDSAGNVAETTRDIQPLKSQMSFATVPAGLRITLEGQPLSTPATVTGVVGAERDLGAPEQSFNGRLYRFASWSQGSAATQAINTPSANTTYTATFNDVGVAPNQPPSVVITVPANGGAGAVGAVMTVTATASDSDGNIVRVTFFDGTTLIGEGTTAPYSISWTPTTAGTRTLTARATDNGGLATVSAEIGVSISVPGSDAQAPTVTLTNPAHLANNITGTITIGALASDNVGVAGVEFQIDGATIGAEDTTAPYGTSINAAAYPSGQHVIRSRARDAAGNVSTWGSATVNFGGSTRVPQGFTINDNWVTLPCCATATAFAQAGDGRFFVALQSGVLRVIKNGVLLATPFHQFTVDFSNERGLLGVALHPNFASNGWVYVYYTAINPNGSRNNRVSRLVANGDVSTGVETTLVDLPTLGSAENHNGGALHFGTDGKLYVAVGDNSDSATPQNLASPFGKLLRFNDDGSRPPDNPFFAQGGWAQSVWAYGLRNPFTFAIQSGTGRVHINDVGQSAWEEVNLGARGANYGWPGSEGPDNIIAGITAPIFAYSRNPAPTPGSGPGGFFTGIAVTGGVFYPAAGSFPAAYRGQFYFSDFGDGFLARMDLANNNAVYSFGRVNGNPLGMVVGIDGALYVLTQQAIIARIASP